MEDTIGSLDMSFTACWNLWWCFKNTNHKFFLCNYLHLLSLATSVIILLLLFFFSFIILLYIFYPWLQDKSLWTLPFLRDLCFAWDSVLYYYFLSFSSTSHNVLVFFALGFSPSSQSLSCFWQYVLMIAVCKGWPRIIRPLITTTVLQLNTEIPRAMREPLWGDKTLTIMSRWGRCGSALITQTSDLPFLSFWFSLQWSVKHRGGRWKRWEGQERARGRNLMVISDCAWNSQIRTGNPRKTSYVHHFENAFTFRPDLSISLPEGKK